MRKIDLSLYASIASRYQAGESTTAIGRDFSVDRHTIGDILRARGISLRDVSACHRIYQCDHSFFDRIDSEPKAYWLGMLAADGYVSVSTNLMGLDLHLKDLVHVYKFRKALGSNHPLRRFISAGSHGGSQMAGLRIASKHIAGSLTDLGFGPRKTYNFHLPRISDSLLAHFVRGYFDGDGSIYLPKTTARWKKSLVTFCSHRQILSEIQLFLHRKARIGGTLATVRPETDICRLVISGHRQLCRVRDLLYGDSTVFLARKRDGFTSAANFVHRYHQTATR